MRYQRQIHDFLNRVGTQHGKAGLTHGHDIGMIPENGQGMAGDGAGRDMKDAWQEFSGNLVHVGNHQKQPLRGCKRSGQRSCRQRAMNSAGSAGFGLHLLDKKGLAENVFSSLG